MFVYFSNVFFGVAGIQPRRTVIGKETRLDIKWKQENISFGPLKRMGYYKSSKHEIIKDTFSRSEEI